ncbi:MULTISPECIES: hypothetical protein [Moorena]|nr:MULTISPECIES: hypothetical protein [Moorena]
MSDCIKTGEKLLWSGKVAETLELFSGATPRFLKALGNAHRGA